MRLKILREHRHVLLAARHAARAARNTLHYSFTGKTYAAKHLEKQFRARPDPWDFESSAAGLERFQKTWELVPHRHYRRILEIGCAEGHFTEHIVDRFPDAEVLAVDFIPLALERARVRCGSRPNVKFEGVDLATQTVRRGLRSDLLYGRVGIRADVGPARRDSGPHPWIARAGRLSSAAVAARVAGATRPAGGRGGSRTARAHCTIGSWSATWRLSPKHSCVATGVWRRSFRNRPDRRT